MLDWEGELRGLRRRLLGLHFRAGVGHIGSSLSCLELLYAVLFRGRRDGEAFLLSKGHAATALYTCLHALGEISDEELATVYDVGGTRLPAHPSAGQFASIPFALGSLGHGLPIAAGMSKANALLGLDELTFVLMSDGETNAGTTWEAGHFAVQHRLDRLMVLVDCNGLQGFGRTREVLGETSRLQLWQGLGFDAVERDGHAVIDLIAQLEEFRQRRNGRPKVIVANTVKGHGVSFMADRLEWHYLPLNFEQYQQALQEQGHA